MATSVTSRTLFLAAAAALGAFWLVGAIFFDGYALDLGSVNFPTPRYFTLVTSWTFFGGLSTILLALAMSRHPGSPAQIDRLAARWNAIPDRRFLIWTCGAALAIPLVLRLWVLQSVPLTDDESAYRFAAELLASGRLWVASPKLKLFFDQNFMINDGRLYPAYFLGWPALLAPGVWVHAPGIINPLLSALTVPPLIGVIRHVAGPSWARAGVLLFLSSPFLQIAAATQLSHTSCLMALTWSLFMYLRTRADDASLRHHAAFAFSFALAFCIRPQSAVAVGLPLVVSWGHGLWHLDSARRRRAAVAFLLPTATLAALFLGSLWAQYGSPLKTGYTRSAEYLVENDFRFTVFRPNELKAFDFSEPVAAIARTVSGVFRLFADLFGWPLSFALLPVALSGFSNRTRLLWGMVGSYLLLMLFQRDWGIDTIGPLHAFELALPILVLTVIGFKNLGERLTSAQNRAVAPNWQGSVSSALLGSLIATSWCGFVPIRLNAVGEIAAHISVALRAPAKAELHRAVIFAPWPFAPPCGSVPRHFVFFRPTNDPDLRSDILWVNHLDIEEDRRLVESLPGRAGYILRWTPACDVTLLPLTGLTSEDVPPGRIRARLHPAPWDPPRQQRERDVIASVRGTPVASVGPSTPVFRD